MRKFFITDLHGDFQAYKNCLESVQFDYKVDKLVCGGDIVDGSDGADNIIEDMLSIENFVLLKSNHDDEAIKHCFGVGIDDAKRRAWLGRMSAKSTYETYRNKSSELIQKHLNFLKKSKYYYIDNSNLFVHAGLRLDGDLEQSTLDDFIWSFKFTEAANFSKSKIKFPNGINNIYIGHSATNYYGGEPEIKKVEFPNNKFVIFCDTGCGNNGKLSIVEYK